MPGLTNYMRHRLMATLADNGGVSGELTYVTLFYAAPSSDGDENGGPLDADEWSPARKIVLPESTVPSSLTPRWTRGPGSWGGWQMTNQGIIEWSEADTTGVPESRVLVAGGVFDAEIGGNLLAWDYLEQPVLAVPGVKVTMPEGKLKIRLHKELQ